MRKERQGVDIGRRIVCNFGTKGIFESPKKSFSSNYTFDFELFFSVNFNFVLFLR
jgi:hypothetical protein